MNSHSRQPPISSTPGYLYYVRLKSDLGIFYKLGFTTMESVHSRFSYQGKGHEKLIDEVLLFVRRDTAYEDEQALHQHYRDKRMLPINESGMPLFDNGQSELYPEDILELDFLSNRNAAGEATRLNVRLALGRIYGNDENEIRAAFAREQRSKETVQKIKSKFSFLVELCQKLQDFNLSERDRNFQLSVEQIITELRAARRHVVMEQLSRSVAAKKDPVAELKNDVIKSMEAIRRQDLTGFEKIVDLNNVAKNLVQTLTTNMCMGSDYMVTALSCNLEVLSEAMFEDGGSTDMLLKPIEDAYKRMLRELVHYGRIKSGQINLPDDPLYRVEPNEDGSAPATLTECYGPACYQESIGDIWIFPHNPTLLAERNAVIFEVPVQNTVTGFHGGFTVRVARLPDGRLTADFPDFVDLCEEAFYHKQDYEIAAGLRDPNLPKLQHYNTWQRELRPRDMEK